MTKSLNDVLKYQPVRRFLEKSSLAVALNEVDPFITAAPCFIAQPRETLIFSDGQGHQWTSQRFIESFHPQTPNCPLCGQMWMNVVGEVIQ